MSYGSINEIDHEDTLKETKSLLPRRLSSRSKRSGSWGFFSNSTRWFSNRSSKSRSRSFLRLLKFTFVSLLTVNLLTVLIGIALFVHFNIAESRTSYSSAVTSIICGIACVMLYLIFISILINQSEFELLTFSVVETVFSIGTVIYIIYKVLLISGDEDTDQSIERYLSLIIPALIAFVCLLAQLIISVPIIKSFSVALRKKSDSHDNPDVLLYHRFVEFASTFIKTDMICTTILLGFEPLICKLYYQGLSWGVFVIFGITIVISLTTSILYLWITIPKENIILHFICLITELIVPIYIIFKLIFTTVKFIDIRLWEIYGIPFEELKDMTFDVHFMYYLIQSLGFVALIIRAAKIITLTLTFTAFGKDLQKLHKIKIEIENTAEEDESMKTLSSTA